MTIYLFFALLRIVTGKNSLFIGLLFIINTLKTSILELSNNGVIATLVRLIIKDKSSSSLTNEIRLSWLGRFHSQPPLLKLSFQRNVHIKDDSVIKMFDLWLYGL